MHSVLFLNLVHLKVYISNNEAATRVPGECDHFFTLKIDIELFNELVLCLNVVPKWIAFENPIEPLKSFVQLEQCGFEAPITHETKKSKRSAIKASFFMTSWIINIVFGCQS